MACVNDAGSKAKKRLFIVDYMCVLPYGHNHGSVALFQRELAPHFDETFACVARPYSVKDALAKGFSRCLYYPYKTIFHVRFDRTLYKLIKNTSLRNFVRRGLRFTENFLLKILVRLFHFDLVMAKVRSNWKHLSCKYNLGQDDFIFFPSADYYGAVSCLDFFIKIGKQAPRIHLRLIGVMENASIVNRTPLADLLKKVHQALAAGLDVSLSAETPKYADHLSRILNLKVFYFPYPLAGNLCAMPSSRPAIVSSIGQGRKDKGYFQLAYIIRNVGNKHQSEINFEIQSMPEDHTSYGAHYERVLRAMANVKLLEPVLTDEEIDAFFRRTAIILLPYDRSIYALRGSALFQEALAYGRPVICFEGLGFSPLIERYQNGYLCSNLDQFAEAIAECAALDTPVWDQRLASSRRLYADDVKEALRQLLGN